MGRQQVGTLSAIKLKTRYWRGAGEDLVTLGYARRIHRKKGCPQWYHILKALPTEQDLDAEVRDHYARTITEWLDVVEEELHELKEEIGEWRGNMQGTGFESTDKYQEVEQAEDDLESALGKFKPERAVDNPLLKDMNVPVAPRVLLVSCSHRAKKKRRGRHWRAQEVCNILRAIAKAAREKIIGAPVEVLDFADMLDVVIQEVEDVDFPTAFGS